VNELRAQCAHNHELIILLAKKIASWLPSSGPIESTGLAGVEPRAFLNEATLCAVRNPGTVTLPGDLKPAKS